MREDGVVHLPVADVITHAAPESLNSSWLSYLMSQQTMSHGYGSFAKYPVLLLMGRMWYMYCMNESFLNIDRFLKRSPDATKSVVTVMFGNPQGSIKEMLDLVVGTDSEGKVHI